MYCVRHQCRWYRKFIHCNKYYVLCCHKSQSSMCRFSPLTRRWYLVRQLEIRRICIKVSSECPVTIWATYLTHDMTYVCCRKQQQRELRILWIISARFRSTNRFLWRKYKTYKTQPLVRSYIWLCNDSMNTVICNILSMFKCKLAVIILSIHTQRSVYYYYYQCK